MANSEKVIASHKQEQKLVEPANIPNLVIKEKLVEETKDKEEVINEDKEDKGDKDDKGDEEEKGWEIIKEENKDKVEDACDGKLENEKGNSEKSEDKKETNGDCDGDMEKTPQKAEIPEEIPVEKIDEDIEKQPITLSMTNSEKRDEKSRSESEKINKMSLDEALSFNIKSRGQFQDINLYKILRGEKVLLWFKLWEVILLNKSILVVCDTPEQCGDMVYGMISLLEPLKCCSEYYPYLTVFDPEYKNI